MGERENAKNLRDLLFVAASAAGLLALGSQLGGRPRPDARTRSVFRRLRRSEDGLRYLGGGIRDVVWLGAGDRILDVNEAFTVLTGHPDTLLLERGLGAWAQIAHPEDRAAFDAALAVAATPGGSLDHELRVVRPDGALRWFHLRSARVEDAADPEPLVVGAAEDITLRKQAEDALHGSEQGYRELFTAAHVGIAISGLDGTLRFANPAAAELLGYGDVDSFLREVNAAGGADAVHVDIEQRRAFVAALGSRPGGKARMTARLRRADGAIFLADISSSLTRQTRTGEMEVTSFLQDVTQQRELEQRLRQAQKMEAVGRLAAAVAHDFSAILHDIVVQTELIAPVNAGQQEAAACIADASRRALDRVQQLLTYSQYDAIEPEELDLHALVAETVRKFRATADPGVALVVRRAPDLRAVFADPRQIAQVLTNLLANAHDALPGEGRIEIETANCEFDAAFRATRPWARVGRYVSVSVRDDGCGIHPDAHEHIYEPFFTTKGIGRGTGLGLATSYSIVKQHQGFIDFTSELDRGSEFTIYLPALASVIVEPSSPAHDGMGGGRGELIMVVDDDDLIRHLAAKTLTRAGYQVVTARDGDDALELFMGHATEVRLLILDVIMPRMDGRLLYENISELRPGVPVLFFSGGHPGFLESEYMLATDGSDFLGKPFLARDLLARVRHLIDQAS